MDDDDMGFDALPLRGKMSWTGALMRLQTRGYCRGIDPDVTNKAKNRNPNCKARNAKAKHRKKFNR